MTYKAAYDCQIKNLFEVYAKYFNNKTFGYFVEIGAFDGYSWSNTWGLAEAGWGGVYVEPVHEHAEQCRERHKNNHVITVECAISDVEGQVKLWLDPNDVSSTVDEETVKKSPWDFPYDPDKFILVPSMTLDTLLNVYTKLGVFDLLVIDVEGAELRVLSGFDWRKWRPAMIIIEDHLGQPNAKAFHADAITKWFEATDYKCLQHDGINSIYVLELK